MSKLGTVWNYIRQHKYLITIALFGVIIVFLDENSLIQRAQHRKEINALTMEIEKYRKQYEEDTRTLKELMNNPEAMGLRHLAFRVEDIVPAVQWLNSVGIETEPIREDPYNGGRFTFFKDPDGLPLELHE